MQLVFIFILSTCCLATALSFKKIEQEWLKFNTKYEKKYRSGEKIKSFQNFKRNLKKIDQHNKRFEQKLTTYKMAINQFSDMDLKQIENEYMGLKISKIETRSFQNIPQVQSQAENNFKLPGFMDWRDKDAITPVKNQLGCGSCWAFSSTGALEAHYFLKYNKTVVLSEQNLVDCVKKNYGCQGGWMIPCFDYIQTNGGINSEYKYPYQAIDGKCRYQSSDVTATCTGYNRIRQGDEQHLLEVVATKGPVSVAIEVNLNFINYVEGIYNDLKCSQMVNHAVLVVGYGTENGQDYWLVKNSWGTKWGEHGFIKMARNKQNQCAIASYAVYPLV